MLATRLRYANGIEFRAEDLAGYFVDYIAGDRNELVITFENADKPNMPRPNKMRSPWGGEVLGKMGFSVLAIKPKEVDWYRGADLHQFFLSDAFQTFLRSFKRIVMYGSSMGGYGALAFASVCQADLVIAYNPQSTLNRALVPWETRYAEGARRDWSGEFADAATTTSQVPRIYVAYDPLERPDRWHIARLKQENIIALKFACTGHNVADWMREAGILKRFLVGALDGTLSQHDCNVMARTRKTIPRHRLVMASQVRSQATAMSLLRLAIADGPLAIHYQNKFAAVIMERRLLSILAGDDMLDHLSSFADDQLFTLAKFSADRGLLGWSLEACKAAMKKRAVGARIYMLAAECLLKLSNAGGAQDFIHDALQIDPRIASAHRLHARILFALEDVAGAADASKAGLELEPKSALGWRELSNYVERLGEIPAALNAARRAFELNPSEGGVRAIIDRLEGSMPPPPDQIQR